MTDADSIENSKELLHQPKKFVIIFALFLQVSGVGTWNLYSLLESRQGQQLRRHSCSAPPASTSNGVNNMRFAFECPLQVPCV
jgi:hypothetical protein